MAFAGTSSPWMLLLFVAIFLWMTMDIRLQDLTATQKWAASILMFFIIAANEGIFLRFGMAVLRKTFVLSMHLPFFLLFWYLTKFGLLRIAFVIFSAMIFSSPPVVAIRFFRQALPSGFWAAHLCDAACYAVMLLLVQLVFRRGFNYLLKYGDNKLFVPFFLVGILYYAYTFVLWDFDLVQFDSISGILLRYLPTIQVFMFYFSLLNNYRELNEKRDLEISQAALNQELDTAAEQLVLLNETQTQAAVYRHDMRHHLNMLSGYLAEGKTAQAEDYIRDIQAGIEAITPRRYCENEAVNLLCSSFAGKAERMGVRLEVEAGLPETLSLPDTELCALISNGLENALNAAAGTEDKWVEFFCGIQANKLLVEIKNSYCGQVTLRDGLPVSNRQGHGYGCYSIKTIAERCHGMYSFQPEDGVFTLRVVLPL